MFIFNYGYALNFRLYLNWGLDLRVQSKGDLGLRYNYYFPRFKA